MNNICWHLVGIKLFSSFSCSFTCYSLFLSFFSFSHSFFFFSVSRPIFPSLYFFFSFSLMQARPLTHKYLRYFIFGNSQSSCLKKKCNEFAIITFVVPHVLTTNEVLYTVLGQKLVLPPFSKVTKTAKIKLCDYTIITTSAN